ncbi:hypothetical protein VTO73DRAFT_2769 [Trametes versicolor]
MRDGGLAAVSSSVFRTALLARMPRELHGSSIVPRKARGQAAAFAVSLFQDERAPCVVICAGGGVGPGTSTGGALGESAWEVRVASRVWGLGRGVGRRGSRTSSGGMHGASSGEQVESFASRCVHCVQPCYLKESHFSSVRKEQVEFGRHARSPSYSYARIPGAPSCIRARGHASRCT